MIVAPLQRLARCAAILSALLPLLLPVAQAAERGPLLRRASAPAEDPSGARVIVRYKSGGGLAQALSAASAARRAPQFAATMAQRTGLALRDGHALDTRTEVLHGDASLSSVALAAQLAADPDVEFAVPDWRRQILALPNDPLFAASASISPVVGQWYLQPPNNGVISAVNAVAAWAITFGSTGVVVADVDTGVRFDHPDLASKLLPGRNFVSNNGSTSSWSADASDPGDFSSANQCGRGIAAEPSSWHGTQVIGLIGAQTDNGIGMASLGRGVMLLPVRALAACGGYDSDIIAAMLWAAGIALPTNDSANVPNPGNVPNNPNPAQVINLSLGSTGSCTGTVYATYIPQIIAAGVTVVAANGNDEGLAVTVPANCTGVIAVGGVRQVGTKVGYSDVGPEVAISAPAGNCVNLTGSCLYPMLTTTNSGTTTPTTNTYTDGTNYSVGTSFATPLVSATAALMRSVNALLTPAQIKSNLQASARGFPAYSVGATTAVPVCHAATGVAQDECLCTTSTCGAGLLDSAAAVALAANTTTPPVAVIVGSTTTPAAGSAVNLSATSSSRSVVSYQWAITGGGNLASFAGAANASTAVLNTSAAGTVQLSLTVTDSAGASSSTTQSLTVVAATGAAPTALIGASNNAPTVGGTVVLDGSGSTAAAGRSITGYQWTITSGSGLATITSASNASSATLATSAAGTVVVSLTVTDSAGATGSASQTITVIAPPTAAFTVSNAAPVAGNAVTLNASASAANGGRSIVGYQWAISSGAGLASFSGATNAGSATLTTTAAGSVTVSLTVTDSAGATGSTAQTITVAAAPVVVTPSGGGAMSAAWLAGLLLAALGLARTPRRND